MKTTSLLPLAAGLTVLSLSSCKNPADDVTDAKLGEAAPEATATGGTTYVFTDASSIAFTGSKVTGSHSGVFKDFDGSFVVVDGEPASGTFVIEMDSTNADAEKLTTHLKSEDFFDVAKFPETEFVVTEFKKTGENAYDLSGNLTLHGVTKNITFPATVEASDEMVKVMSEFDINRHDFGVDFPGKKDDLIRKEVIIKLDLEAKPAS